MTNTKRAPERGPLCRTLLESLVVNGYVPAALATTNELATYKLAIPQRSIAAKRNSWSALGNVTIELEEDSDCTRRISNDLDHACGATGLSQGNATKQKQLVKTSTRSHTSWMRARCLCRRLKMGRTDGTSTLLPSLRRSQIV